MKLSIILAILASVASVVGASEVSSPVLPVVETVFSPAKGLGPQDGVMRRDPSDVIKVEDHYYVWYSKGRFQHGYDATIWYATSPDGHTWIERGEALARGTIGGWDEQSVFTPNILVAEGKYWLFFTAVPKPFVAKGPGLSPTAIGLAVSCSPDGPWKKFPDPVMRPRGDDRFFDGVRLDDACLLVKDGKYWLYYKGRQAIATTPHQTKMGLAIADRPQGPYVRAQDGPVIEAGHEVLVWPDGHGVAAMVSNHGPDSLKNRIFYAGDGIHFVPTHRIGSTPSAAGGFRPEAFSGSGNGEPIEWGIHIVEKKPSSPRLPYLQRFDLRWPTSDNQ